MGVAQGTLDRFCLVSRLSRCARAPQRAPSGPVSNAPRLRHARNPVNHGEKVRAFWARYAEKVRESGAKAPFDRWLVVRTEEYVAAHPGRKLAEQSPADVDAYLAELGRKPGVKGWQVRQAADAIRMLLEMAGARWVE